MYADELKSTISQKLKMGKTGKLIFNSFQNIACHFGPKNVNDSYWGGGGGGGCISFTRTGPENPFLQVYAQIELTRCF